MLKSCADGSRRSWGIFDLPEKRSKIAELEKQTLDQGFWSDHKRAQSHMQHLNALKSDVSIWDGLVRRSEELVEFVELAGDESDDGMLDQLVLDAAALRSDLEGDEFRLQLNGEHDDRTAILSVKQGAGGVDAQDWSEMLLRMYSRWGEQAGYDTEVLDFTPGEEAGIKAAALRVTGDHAYGFLKSERGVHRLVRLSPFDSGHRRHTSFSLVEVYPEPDVADEVEIDPSEVRMEAFRASGHGGQSVQKNSTAVRLTHEPSGIVVSVQNERSQAQNRQVAMKILLARLTDVENQRRVAEKARLKGDHISAEFGRQVRSYVLHPYQMVKDHRTDHEVSDARGVLEGDLDGFLKAYLQSSIGD